MSSKDWHNWRKQLMKERVTQLKETVSEGKGDTTEGKGNATGCFLKHYLTSVPSFLSLFKFVIKFF